MASLISHTVVQAHTTEASESPNALRHSRNLSTISSATLLTNTTLHSQPYEPLLRPISPTSAEYYDVVSHPSKESDRSLALPRWSQNSTLSRQDSVLKEKGYIERKPLKSPTRIQMRRWGKRILQMIMSLWSIYSTVRYLLAFTIYQSITGQVVSLVLGAATGLSFAFSSCGSILTMAQTTLLLHGISVKALLSIRATLYYMASCCLLGPSVVNLVLLFLWKKSPDLELQTRHRCKLDVDLVWSTTYSLCNHRNKTWARWVALSALRLAVTLIIIIAFHAIASSAQFTPARSFSKPRYTKSKKSHSRLESCETPLIHTRSQSSVLMAHHTQDPTLQRQGSESTLSVKSSPRNRLRNSRSRSSAFSEEETHLNVPNNSEAFLPIDPVQPPAADIRLVDRFRLLLAQYTRDAEEAVQSARSEGSASHKSGSSPSRKEGPDPDVEDEDRPYHYANGNDDDDDFYSNAAVHTVDVHDYDQTYPADEHVRMMNAYIRRMPTIESMGSRERQTSFISSSAGGDHDRTGTASRPPTRNTLASWGGSFELSGSEPRSRPNSLSAQAELLAGMFGRINTTEIGELMLRGGDTVRMVGGAGPQHEVSANDDYSEAQGELGHGDEDEYASTTTGSKDSKDSTTSGASYHTASTGSTMSLASKLADATATPLALAFPGNLSPLRHTVIQEASEP